MNPEYLSLPKWLLELYLAAMIVQAVCRLTPTKKDDWIADMIEGILALATPGVVRKLIPNLNREVTDAGTKITGHEKFADTIKGFFDLLKKKDGK